MHPEIASLHDRMAQGGDWRAFQQEIARLNKEARTQQEYVVVLEAHRNLIAVAEHCFPSDTAAEIRRIGEGEYKLFLNVEAMEGDLINPIILDRITAREVAAGRLAPDDELRKLAEDAGSVMGDSAGMDYDRKLGSIVGTVGLVLGAAAFFLINKWLGVVLFVAGIGVSWFINETRRKRLLETAQLQRVARGYE